MGDERPAECSGCLATNPKYCRCIAAGGRSSLSKRCGKCAREFNISSFHRASRRRDGFKSWCKSCCAAHSRDRYANDNMARAEAARARLVRDYGITPEDRLAMLKRQNSKCAICRCYLVIGKSLGGTRRHAVVDHCHASGKVRGLLCSQCNTAIGMLNDSLENLSAAIQYLEAA